jgi:hypothetical protein
LEFFLLAREPIICGAVGQLLLQDDGVTHSLLAAELFNLIPEFVLRPKSPDAAEQVRSIRASASTTVPRRSR